MDTSKITGKTYLPILSMNHWLMFMEMQK
jgi:hypothetical protein